MTHSSIYLQHFQHGLIDKCLTVLKYRMVSLCQSAAEGTRFRRLMMAYEKICKIPYDIYSVTQFTVQHSSYTTQQSVVQLCGFLAYSLRSAFAKAKRDPTH